MAHPASLVSPAPAAASLTAWPQRRSSRGPANHSTALQNNLTSRASTPAFGQSLVAMAKGEGKQAATENRKKVAAEEELEEEVEEEEEGSWVSERLEDAKEATQALVQAVPGPRVGSSSVPWLVALPLAYMGLTFVIAVFKTIRKFNSPKAKRKRQVGKNAFLMEELDAFFPDKRETFAAKDLSRLESKFGFTPDEIMRKYVRYVINEKPFTPEAVDSLIRLRQATSLSDEEVAEVLNEISRRIVKAKGPVVMDTAGFTEKGIQRKAAVQAIFTKLLYLSELESFCSLAARGKLEVKSIFGVTDEDADSIRIVSLSSSDDLEKLDKSLEKGDGSDDEDDA